MKPLLNLAVRVAVLVLFVGLLLAGTMLPAPSIDPLQPIVGPSWGHPFGLSPYGHDLLWLTAHSSARAAGQAVWATGLTLLIAVPVGMTAAWLRNGLFDGVQRTLARVLDSLGVFLIAACLAALAHGVSLWELASFLALIAWPNLSHTVRAETIAALDRPYVEGARAIGVGPVRMAFVYLLPEMLDRLVPPAVAMVGSYVGVFGALQFLGIGVADELSLGFMVYDASQNYLRAAPWYFAASFGGFALLLLIVAAVAALFHTTSSPEPASDKH